MNSIETVLVSVAVLAMLAGIAIARFLRKRGASLALSIFAALQNVGFPFFLVAMALNGFGPAELRRVFGTIAIVFISLWTIATIGRFVFVEKWR